MSEQPDGSTLLPEWFVPSNLDVIVGWARQNHQHGTFAWITFALALMFAS